MGCWDQLQQLQRFSFEPLQMGAENGMQSG
jgi:hypothetical protein